MKVRIYTWFTSGNIGDILIAKTVSEIFSKHFSCKFYDIGSGVQTQKESLLLNDRKRNKFKLKILSNQTLFNIIAFIYSFRKSVEKNFSYKDECDSAIFAGGNSIMDLGKFLPADSIVLYRKIKALKKNNIKIAFCFCGVGPFNNSLSKKIVLKTLKEIDFISVRDRASYEMCVKLGKTENLELWYDPVLLYSPPMEFKTKNTIAVNVFFGQNKLLRNKMADSYIKLVKCLRNMYPNYTITLFATEAMDRADLNEVAESFADIDKVIVENVDNADDLFKIYAKSATLIGCRMHSLITATISRVPVVAIGWQQKVYSFMESFQLEDLILTQEEFCKSSEAIIPMINKSLNMDEDELKKRDVILSNIKLDLLSKIDSFTKKWSGNYEL